jgi:AcrR family transcriptional regulator
VKGAASTPADAGTPVVSRTPQRRAKSSRRSQILELFTDMVAARGYDQTSINDLAVELGVSKGTIIHHYSSKDQLLFEMSVGYMQRRMVELEVILESTDNPVEQLELVIMALFLVHRDDRDATLAVSREFVRFISEPLVADVRALRAEYRVAVEGIIERGVESGTFRDTAPGILALQIFGMCNWAWTWFRPSDKKWSAEQVVDVFLRTTLSGVLVDAQTVSAPLTPLPAAIDKMRRERQRDRATLLAGHKVSS